MIKRSFIILLLLVIIVANGLWWSAAAPAFPGRAVDFVIQPGQEAKAISRNLKTVGLIRSDLAFRTYIWWRKADNRLQAGTYSLSTGYSLPRLVDSLLSAESARQRTLTFIEGWNLRDYEDYLKQERFDVTDFSDLSPASVWADKYVFLQGLDPAQTLEGYLFPDTYAVEPGESLDSIISRLLNNFERKIEPRQATIEKRGKTVHQIITLASIVENEVSTAKDRRLVADIFWKRLDLGQALQSDATINYLTDSGRIRSTADDLAIDSPYNTYKYAGLPPGPISNPSLESIEAVITPEANDYYYFLTDKNGIVHYGRDFEEHQKNREQYLE